MCLSRSHSPTLSPRLPHACLVTCTPCNHYPICNRCSARSRSGGPCKLAFIKVIYDQQHSPTRLLQCHAQYFHKHLPPGPPNPSAATTIAKSDRGMQRTAYVPHRLPHDDPPHALRLRSLIRLQDPRQVAQHRQHKPRPDLARAVNSFQTPKRALQKRQDARSGVGPRVRGQLPRAGRASPRSDVKTPAPAV